MSPRRLVACLFSSLALSFLALGAACSCQSRGDAAGVTAPLGPQTIVGRVRSERGGALAGAEVSLAAVGGGEVSAQSTSDEGGFSLTATPAASGGLAFAARAAGHAGVVKPFLRSGVGTFDVGDIILRPSTSQMLALPAGDQPPASMSVEEGGLSLKLDISAGDLVDSAGRVASGSADVTLTYWHPGGNLKSLPADLLAQSGNDVVPMTTYGMAGVDIQQGGQPLDVAPGRTLALTFAQPSAFGPIWDLAPPDLFALDETTGLWKNMGGIAAGMMTRDAASGAVTAHLPHLSYWNVDGEIRYSNGGCVQGTLYDSCNPTQRLPFTPVTVWFLTNEQVKNFSGVTDAQGRYCIPTPISDYQYVLVHGARETTFYVNYFVSGSNIENTNMCDPLPPPCRLPDSKFQTWRQPDPGTVNTMYNHCELYIPDSPPFRDPDLDNITAPIVYYDTCAPPTDLAPIVGCTFCAGRADTPANCTLPNSSLPVRVGQCTELKPAYVRSPGCICSPPGQSCGAGQGCCPGPLGLQSLCDTSTNTCRACTGIDQTGSVCNPAAGCCTSPGGLPLTCGDGVCLPTF